MTCNSCQVDFDYRSQEIQLNIFNVKHNISFTELKKNNSLDVYFHFLFDIAVTKKFDYKKQQWEIREEETIECPFCKKKNIIYHYHNLSQQFSYYTYKYILAILNSITLDCLDSEIKDSYYLYPSYYLKLTNALPFKFLKQKRILKKLFKIHNKLPFKAELGANIEILEWFIEQICNNIFTIVFCTTLSGIKKILFFIKKDYLSKKVCKMIQQEIKKEKVNFKELTMEEIISSFNIPEDYTGSKEQLIENIINTKAMEYKEQLIEKIRKSVK